MAIHPTTINDLPEDCTMRVIFFSESAPRCAPVSKSWYAAAARCYAPIFADYRQDAKIFPFTPATMPTGDNRFFKAVKQTYRTVMDRTHAPHIQGALASLERSTLPLDLHPALKIAKTVFSSFFRIIKPTYRSMPPLDLHPVLKIVEDANLVRFFEKLQLLIPVNERPLLKGDLARRSATIREWMENHQASLDQRVIHVDLSDLDLTTLPPEIGNCTNLSHLRLSNIDLYLDPLRRGVMADLCALDKIIGAFEERKTEEALKMFKELPIDTKNGVYGELYNILRRFQNDYHGCGRDAFLGRNGQRTSNKNRTRAIGNFIDNSKQ